MSLSLKESRAGTEMAKVLYNFLPGSGWKQWKGHISFQSVAQEVGVGDFWQIGSKEPAIAALLERTLEFRRQLFEKLVLSIVKAALKYRQKNNNPIREDEIKTLNGLILEIGFKFPWLWDPNFLNSLKIGRVSRGTKIVEQELATEKILETKQSELMTKREQLKSQFYEFSRPQNRQMVGLNLEKILNELFELSGLTPRTPFRIVGEQIDGSFILDNEIL